MLKKLTELCGVSGNEFEVSEYIRKETEPYCTKVSYDSMGNLTAFKKGLKSEKTVALFAHTDEVGFMITQITDEGYLKFRPVGGIDPQILVSKQVTVNGRLNGVISFKAVHLSTKEEREKRVNISDLFIDIGANSKEEAMKYVSVGDYCSFKSDYVQFGNDLVKAKALDDRVGCAILIEALKKTYNVDLYAVFTVQEEVGLRGAKTAAYALNPDYALVVEGTTCSDITGTPKGKNVTELGKGAAISILDSASFSNKEIRNMLVEVAKKNNIDYQFKASTRGGNDAGTVHIQHGGIKTASISVPCRYIHSPVCVMNKNDFNSCKSIVLKFLEEVGNTYENIK